MAETTPTDGPEATVSLRELTSETFSDVLRLKVAPGQERFVASNDTSIAEAYFSPRAWFRGVYADEVPVGFVMVEAPDPAASGPEGSRRYLWRFMIAAEHQGKGYGRRALEALIDHLRDERGATELLTSCVPGEGSPCPFYRRLGFAETGEIEDGEVVMRLALVGASSAATA